MMSTFKKVARYRKWMNKKNCTMIIWWSVLYFKIAIVLNMYSLELFIDFTLTERTFLDIVAKSEIIQPFVEQIVITFSWVALSENLSQDCYS